MKSNDLICVCLSLIPLAGTTGLAESNGPLRVHTKNPRYFTDNSGRAILLAGAAVLFLEDNSKSAKSGREEEA